MSYIKLKIKFACANVKLRPYYLSYIKRKTCPMYSTDKVHLTAL